MFAGSGVPNSSMWRGDKMAKYYFVRHGEADFTEANTKIYQGWGFNMLTLSRKGHDCLQRFFRKQRNEGSWLQV